MKNVTNSRSWKKLQAHYDEMKEISLSEHFQNDPHRFKKFSFQSSSLLLDCSKNHITETTVKLLIELAEHQQLNKKIRQLFYSEDSASYHTDLRNLQKPNISTKNARNFSKVQAALKKISNFVKEVHEGTWQGYKGDKITDIINVGIGGSDLGPRMTSIALNGYRQTSLNFHFISNCDGENLEQLLNQLNAATSLFIISSKSFSTLETLSNAKIILKWFDQQTPSNTTIQKNFIAITEETSKAEVLGFTKTTIFPMLEKVGGRYSIWSAIGLPLALMIGVENFYTFLQGAANIDEHFLAAPFRENLPVILALITIWYTNFFNSPAHAILPYHQSFSLLPQYLQQLEMESNGKSMSLSGERIDYSTCPIIFGELGLNAQHAFYQLLHQGTMIIPSDFILSAKNHSSFSRLHEIALCSGLGQSQAFMQGNPTSSLFSNLPGNRPSNTLFLEDINPFSLGQLIALYEHKVFVQSVIWNINPFDQGGVEYGKNLVLSMLKNLESKTANYVIDSSTKGLLQFFYEHSKK